jgi:hypothetical protein
MYTCGVGALTRLQIGHFSERIFNYFDLVQEILKGHLQFAITKSAIRNYYPTPLGVGLNIEMNQFPVLSAIAKSSELRTANCSVAGQSP